MPNYDLLVIVINYNSKPFIGIVKKLMEGIAELNKYLSTKLLFVDNASSDGSFEEATEHARKAGADIEAVKLSKNFGFTRAVNIAWHYARKKWSFKYLALINNDLVITPRNLAKLAKYLEIDGVAGVQGTIMQMNNPHLIDNSGFMIDQHGLTYPVCRGYPFSCAKLYTPSFLSGACSLYRADAIDELGQPFDNRVESYYDDKHLGFRLWSRDYKLLHVPIIVAYHLGSASYSYDRKTIKGPKWFEGIVFADLAMIVNSKSFFYPFTVLYIAISVLMSILTMNNYIKSCVIAIKKLRNFTDETIVVGKIPQIAYIKSLLKYNRLYKGLQLKIYKNIFPSNNC
ncbi:MAG: glycosyltransferase [Desulfurococcaceae archaeon]